jgi:uncharacterized protein
MRCAYCSLGYAQSGDYGKKPSLLSESIGEQAIEFLVREAKTRDTVTINLFGGEPLLNFELIEHIYEYGERVANRTDKTIVYKLTTNGVLLNKQIIDFLVQRNFVVSISLDGPAYIHDANRRLRNGRASYEYILPGVLELIQGSKFPVAARVTIYHSESQLTNILEHLVTLGIRMINWEVAVLNNGLISLTEDGLSNLTEQFRQSARTFLEGIMDNSIPPFYPFTSYLGGIVAGERRLFPCRAGRSMVAVDTEGIIYPCHKFIGRKERQIGHVTHGISHATREILTCYGSVDSKRRCKSCWARYLCGGPCFYQLDAIQANLDLDSLDEKACYLNELRSALCVGILGQLISEKSLWPPLTKNNQQI